MTTPLGHNKQKRPGRFIAQGASNMRRHGAAGQPFIVQLLDRSSLWSACP